jgi:hypothetical protein
MDKSKLPGITKKSSETPWSPAHERSKLSDRAGTTGRKDKTKNIAPIWTPLTGHLNTTIKGKTKKSWKGEDVSEADYKEGKYPGTDKPGKKRKFRWQDKVKGKKDEREY